MSGIQIYSVKVWWINEYVQSIYVFIFKRFSLFIWQREGAQVGGMAEGEGETDSHWAGSLRVGLGSWREPKAGFNQPTDRSHPGALPPPPLRVFKNHSPTPSLSSIERPGFRLCSQVKETELTATTELYGSSSQKLLLPGHNDSFHCTAKCFNPQLQRTV